MKKNKKALLKRNIKNEEKQILQQLKAPKVFQSKGYTTSYNFKPTHVNTCTRMKDQIMYYRHHNMDGIVSCLLNNIDNKEKIRSFLHKYIDLRKKVTSSMRNTVLIKKGTSFYRSVSSPDYITKPPACNVSIGRLNKKKESILYLAFSPDTAYSEVGNDYMLHFVAKKDFYAICSFQPNLDQTFSDIERELDTYTSELCNRILSLTPQKCNLPNEKIYSLTNKLKDIIFNPTIPVLIYPSTKFINNTSISINNIIDTNDYSLDTLNCAIFKNEEELVTCIKEDTYKYKEK